MAIICKSTTIKTVKVQNSNGTTTEIFSVLIPNAGLWYNKLTVSLNITYTPSTQYQASYQTFKWQATNKFSTVMVRPFYTNEVTGVTTYLAASTMDNSGEYTLQLPRNTNMYDATNYTYTVGVCVYYPNGSYANAVQYTGVTQTDSRSGSLTIVI